jgi:hypothetical protein
MANYLVASGSRKISDLEIAQFPIPGEGTLLASSSVIPLVIGDTFPATNATTVQIQTRDFIDALVFNASGSYTGNNQFTGSNLFTGSVTIEDTFLDLPFLTSGGEQYYTNIRGGMVAIADFNSAPALVNGLRLRATNGNGFVIEEAVTVAPSPVVTSSIMTFGPLGGRVDILRETHFSQNVVITGSLTALEIFTTYETASILYSSGSTKFGDTMDDIHSFTGSVKLSGSIEIVDGGTIDGIDLSVYSQSLSAESASFEDRVTENSQSLSLLSGSYETFSGSQYNADSSSFEDRVTENSQSLSLLSGSYETFSGSQYNTDSQSFEDRVTENSQSLSLLSSSYETFSGSQYNADSSSFEDRVTSLSTASGSFSTRVSDLENFSSSQYNTDSQSFEDRVTENSQSLSLLSGSFLTHSGSFSTRVTQNEGDISILSSSYETFSGSQYNTDSQSFEDRVTENSQSLSLLSGSFLTHSGSFSTRVTTNETNISQNTGDITLLSASFETTSSKLITASGSFSTRVTSVEGSVSGLSTDSASFQGRITSIESFTSSIDTTIKTKLNVEGVISSSQQVNADTITNFDSNVLTYIDSKAVVSSSQQVNADSITNFDSNVLTYVNSLGAFSGSQQVNADNVTNFDTNVSSALTSISVTQHNDVTNAGSGQIITSAERTRLGNAELAYSVSVIGGSTNAVVDTLYVLTASLTLTLPGSPSVGDRVGVSNQSGTTTPVVGRNGNLIQGIASDLTLDVDGMGLQLIYTGATKGWIIL